MKAVKWLDEHFEEFFLVVILTLIACVELVQVIYRNLPFVDALKWAEEFCRFCWIWSVFLSLPYTIRKGSMLRVNVLAEMLPRAARKTVNILIDLINAAVMAILFVNAITVVKSIKADGKEVTFDDALIDRGTADGDLSTARRYIVNPWGKTADEAPKYAFTATLEITVQNIYDCGSNVMNPAE